MKEKILAHYNMLATDFYHAYITGDDEYAMYLSAMIDTIVRECKLFELDILPVEELEVFKNCMEKVTS